MAHRKELCGKGIHDMEEHGRELPKEKGGGRYCVPCKAETGRRNYFKQQLRKALRELEEEQAS